MTDDHDQADDPVESEAPFDPDTIERNADRAGVDASDLGAALTEVNSTLIGRHAELERAADYVSVEQRRAYRVEPSWWEDTLADFDLPEGVATAVRMTHTERAKLAFEDSVEGDERFGDDEGVVVGVDTAEQF